MCDSSWTRGASAVEEPGRGEDKARNGRMKEKMSHNEDGQSQFSPFVLKIARANLVHLSHENVDDVEGS
jgi:hypothetical protein